MSIAVVTPTYNRSRLVQETLRAILAQTRQADEIIVVDDGSTDDTPDVLHRFPVRALHIANGGPGQARNAGVQAATAEWIAFCEADDLWRPTYLERFLAHVRPGSFYGFANWLDVVDGEWTDTDKFGAAPAGFFERGDQPLYRKLVDFTPIWPSATLIRREFFQKIGGFDPSFSRFPTEDFEFALRCNEHAPAIVMHEALVGIRKHEGNFSRGRIRQNLSDAAILSWARDHHRLGRHSRSAIDRSIVHRRLAALNEAFASGKLTEVRDIARILPADALPSRARIKVAVAQSRVVPGRLLRGVLGRPEDRRGVPAAAAG